MTKCLDFWTFNLWKSETEIWDSKQNGKQQQAWICVQLQENILICLLPKPLNVFWSQLCLSHERCWDYIRISPPSVMKDNKILIITSLPPHVKGRRVSSSNFTAPASPPWGGSSSSTVWCWAGSASSWHLPGSASTSTYWVWPACRNSDNKGKKSHSYNYLIIVISPCVLFLSSVHRLAF